MLGLAISFLLVFNLATAHHHVSTTSTTGEVMLAQSDDHSNHDHSEDSHSHDSEDSHDHSHEHREHNHSHHDHSHADERVNIVTANGVDYAIEPLFDANGSSQLLVTSDCATAANLTFTSPRGVSYAGEVQNCYTTTIDFVFETGIWQLEGSFLDTSVSLFAGVTNHGSDVRGALVPTPSVSSGARSEVFVSAFAGGEHIHKTYNVQRAMQGMTHMSDEDIITLEHRHYDDHVDEGFYPVGNSAPLSFMMPGEWKLDVQLEGGLDEQASFTVEVLGE